jgi:succinoglycan biosynthesis protein ExoM
MLLELSGVDDAPALGSSFRTRNQNNSRTHITIGACTCRRPQMLRRCLTAIAKLTQPEGADLSIIVVDNESEPNNRPIVEEFAGAVYAHEPLRGISHARNDDAEPAEYWLDQLLEVQREADADVVRGRTVYTYPDPLPRWILKPNRLKRRAVEESWPAKPVHVGANNVLFSAQLVRRDGLGLRFDPRFNAIGGEDTDFFTRAWERGAYIVASDLPVVFEEMTPERCTYWRQIRRQMQYATGNTIIDLDGNRTLSALLEAIARLLSGLWWMGVALVLGVFSTRRFRKHALRAGKKVMYTTGVFLVLAGYRYQGYRAIDGS